MDGLTFAALVRAIRDRYDLSCGQLARRLGCDASYISRLEAGTRQPSRAFVARLAAVCADTPALARACYTAAGYLPPPGLEPPDPNKISPKIGLPTP